MKKFLILLSMLFCGTAYAQTETLNWYIGDDVYATTTCESGNDILLPTTPTKRGYTFKGWAEYIPIEYLESTGTQWIDTGVIANTTTEIELVVSSSILHQNGIIGDRWDGFTPFLMFANNFIKWHFVASGSIISDRVQIKPNTQIYIKASNGALQVNSDYYYGNPISNFSSNTTLKLFFLEQSSGRNRIFKIYYLKIYDNDILVRDFIPVLDKNGTPCMFDKVEKKFYYNQGTGDFIAGPVLNE